MAGGAVEARPATKKAKASHGAAVATSTSNGASGGANGASASTSPGLSTSGRMNLKNPSVDTSFLPDRQREERERRLREELRQEWLRKQEAMKGETIEITYSFWDGSGHRKSVMVRDQQKKCLGGARSADSVPFWLTVQERRLDCLVPGQVQTTVSGAAAPRCRQSDVHQGALEGWGSA